MIIVNNYNITSVYSLWKLIMVTWLGMASWMSMKSENQTGGGFLLHSTSMLGFLTKERFASCNDHVAGWKGSVTLQ